MSTDMLQTYLIIITVVVAIVAIVRSYMVTHTVDLTPSTLVETIKEAQPVAKELMEVAQIAVNATEQLKREGKIASNDQAFNHALDLVKKWIPDQWEVDNEDIIAAINSAVLVASALSKQAGKSSEDKTLKLN